MKKRLLEQIPICTSVNIIDIAARLSESSIKYIVVGRIDCSILVLHFFSTSGKAEFRTFLGRDDYITQRLDCAKWLTGSLSSIIPWDGYYWNEKVLLADNETVEAIGQLVGTDKMPLAALEDHQKAIMAARLAKKHKAILDRINEQMKLVGDIPADFEDWLDKTAFADYRYIFYAYKSGRKKGYCTACYTDVEIEKPRHNKQGICPNCSRQVTYKVLGKTKNLRNQIQAALFQKIPTGFIVRYFAVYRHYEDFRKPVFELSELNRDFYLGDQCKMYNYGKFKQTDMWCWCENTQGSGSPWAIIYDRNLPEAISDSLFKYCAIKEFANHSEAAIVNVYGYLSQYREMPFIEYLTKLKLYNLVKNLSQYDPIGELNEAGTNVMEILKVKKPYMKLLQEMNADNDELHLIQELSRMNISATSQYVSELLEKYGKYDSVRLVERSKYASIERIERYCQKRVDKDNSLQKIFGIWDDYITFCERLEYDLKNDFVLFPRHLKKAHDALSRRITSQKKAERARVLNDMTKGITDYLEELNRTYAFENEAFVIVVPRNLNELVTEGHNLRHCVGTYAEDMAKRKTIVLFVRRKSEREKPFYTMEIQGNEVRQCRGKRNKDMDDEVKAFVEEFERQIIKQRRAS